MGDFADEQEPRHCSGHQWVYVVAEQAYCSFYSPSRLLWGMRDTRSNQSDMIPAHRH